MTKRYDIAKRTLTQRVLIVVTIAILRSGGKKKGQKKRYYRIWCLKTGHFSEFKGSIARIKINWLRYQISFRYIVNPPWFKILLFQTITISDALIAKSTFRMLNLVCTINPNLFSYSIWELLDTNLINLRHESKCVNGSLPKAGVGNAESWLIIIGIKAWLAWGVFSLAFIVRARPLLPNKASVKCLVLAKTWP